MHRLREEAWVVLDGLPNYAISSYGRVVKNSTGEELTPEKDEDGNLRIRVVRNGKAYWVYLHRLVAMAFFVNYTAYQPVYFKNGNREDCTVLNLTLRRDTDESRAVPPSRGSTGGDA